jgi:hypothetical protein
MLLLPSVTPAAAAGDDPAPQAWPTIQDPGNTGGSTDDPKQVDWPAVAQPDVGSATDPKPKQWPAPQQG